MFVEFATGHCSLPPSNEVLESSGKRIVIEGKEVTEVVVEEEKEEETTDVEVNRFQLMPLAHTYLWTIEMPRYRTKKELRKKLERVFSTIDSNERGGVLSEMNELLHLLQ